MSQGAGRARALRPEKILIITKDFLRKNRDLDEVLIRRLISSLYFSLFNYWSAKVFEAGRRGAGKLMDSFKYSEFHGDIRVRGLDPYIKLIHEARVAVDHYTLNPTIVTIYNGYTIQISIDKNCLINVLKASETILKLIDSI